jgi:hypothetical protein
LLAMRCPRECDRRQIILFEDSITYQNCAADCKLWIGKQENKLPQLFMGMRPVDMKYLPATGTQPRCVPFACLPNCICFEDQFSALVISISVSSSDEGNLSDFCQPPLTDTYCLFNQTRVSTGTPPTTARSVSQRARRIHPLPSNSSLRYGLYGHRIHNRPFHANDVPHLKAPASTLRCEGWLVHQSAGYKGKLGWHQFC